MADNLSQTVVGLGYVPVDRGDWEKNYQSNPETRYFNDNIAQYKGSAFIADVTAENAEGNAGTEDNPRYYITAKPYEESVEELNPGWKIFASDAEFAIKYFAQFFTEKENPEFCYIIVDKNKKILFGFKWNGEPYFGVGCPQQVKDYIEERISELSLDEYEAIVAFLDGLIGSDTTLKMMLDSLEENKVDKEEGKSLIDSEHADAASHIENPEYLQVTTDSEDKVLEGIQADGTKVIGRDLNVGGSATISGDVTVLGNVELNGASYSVVKNPEYVKALVDAEDKLIIGVKTDGTVYIPVLQNDSIDAQLQEAISKIEKEVDDKLAAFDELISVFSVTSNPEWIQVTTDSEGKILEGITAEGKKKVMVETQVEDSLSAKKVDIDGATIENIQDPEGRTEIKTDADNRILSYRDSDGKLYEEVGIETPTIKMSSEGLTDLERDMKANGFSAGVGDWSDYLSNGGDKPLHLAMPRRAIVNILSDFNLINLSKKGREGAVEGVNYDIPTQIEFWDMQGNYFKKKVLMSGQGNSTMKHRKKNIALDFFDDDWGGDAFSIRFGNWVPQDSFHLKSYDSEPFVGAGMWNYKLYEEILNTRGAKYNRTWKKATLDYSLNKPWEVYGETLEETSIFNDTGARCFPDGFPCIVYQNGEFWGMFVWQLKKHRDNYHMGKSDTKNIHLDGYMHGDFLFDADGDSSKIAWNQFEVRNPKNLVYADVHTDLSGKATFKYDADIADGQAEIAGSDKNYDGDWVAGSYAIGRVVKHNDNYFINQVANNDAEPITQDSKGNKNTAKDPDFKNKTKCGWVNCSNTVKVKNYILTFTTLMPKLRVLERAYYEAILNTAYWEIVDYVHVVTAEYTAYDAEKADYAENDLVQYRDFVFRAKGTMEAGTLPLNLESSAGNTQLAALKAEIVKNFDIDNLIDYICLTDATRDDDAFFANWQWTTWDGKKWWVNLYDCDQSFGYHSGTGTWFRVPLDYHCVIGEMDFYKDYHVLNYILLYYTAELNARWAELRNMKIIDPTHIFDDIVRKWIETWGYDTIETEIAKWEADKAVDNEFRVLAWIEDNIRRLDRVYSYNQ